MDDFSIDQLMLFIGGVLGSLGALLLVIQKSKCEEIKCCCWSCKRNVQAIIEEERLQLTGHATTPRRSERLKEKKNNFELKEPETEPEPEPEPQEIS
tara:strand:+ start:1337 stop:1627 length:291 start_codon:yes stop_codon:yes gene_type:complete